MKLHPLAMLLVSLTAMLLLAGTARAVTHDVQVGPSLSFSPPEITIATGDSVVWTWGGGLHNVVSGSGALCSNSGLEFCSGGPSLVVGTTFSHTFTTSGDYPYVCGVHSALGMTGVVHVMTAEPSVPGLTPWTFLGAVSLLAIFGSTYAQNASRFSART